jgi:hypothetical protein
MITKISSEGRKCLHCNHSLTGSSRGQQHIVVIFAFIGICQIKHRWIYKGHTHTPHSQALENHHPHTTIMTSSFVLDKTRGQQCV